MSSVNVSSMTLGSKKGQTKKQFNILSNFGIFERYSFTSPRLCILRHQHCPRLKRHPFISVLGRIVFIARCIGNSKSTHMTSQNLFYKVEISSSVDATEVYILKTPDATDVLSFHDHVHGDATDSSPSLHTHTHTQQFTLISVDCAIVLVWHHSRRWGREMTYQVEFNRGIPNQLIS